MTLPFLDPNILLRRLTNDDPDRGLACFSLVQRIDRSELAVWTSEPVIAEVVFVLSNKHIHNLPRETIRDLLLPLISLPGLNFRTNGCMPVSLDSMPPWTQTTSTPIMWP